MLQPAQTHVLRKTIHVFMHGFATLNTLILGISFLNIIINLDAGEYSRSLVSFFVIRYLDSIVVQLASWKL